ncbi:MAG: hypothetical protein JG766_79 [Desulfacinum sp.]|jgi:hypothetical protein|nr:hypothetical protein [Desulfacinum sp.]
MERKGRNRRRHERYRLDGTVFAAVRPDYVRVGPIVDAGPGGVALEYTADLEGLEGRGVTLDVFFEGRQGLVRAVPCRVVCDVGQTVPSGRAGGASTRRCGLQLLESDPVRSRSLEQIFLAHRVSTANGS